MRAELYKITLGGSGALSIMARPRGGDWLPDEVQAWQDARVDVIVSLLTLTEQQELELVDESSLCQQSSLTYLSYPIPDRDVPSNFSDANSVIEALARYVTQGKHVALHCRMGIGRSAMIAAATLILLGESSERAFTMVQKARGCDVPDTDEQRRWVEDFAARIQRSVQE